jgi:hypothetical protein
MSTTTPRFRLLQGAVPTPRIESRLSPVAEAINIFTRVLPISSTLTILSWPAIMPPSSRERAG